MTKHWLRLCPGAFGLWLIVGLTGCIAPPFNIGNKTDPPTPAGSIKLTGGESTGDPKDLADKRDSAEKKKNLDASAYDELDAAKRLMKENDLVNAEKILVKLADNVKNPLDIIEEARFKEGECQMLREDFRNAAPTFRKQLKDVPDGKFTQKALEQLFVIANLWLNDTREQMKLYDQQRKGKVWFVAPMTPVHFDKKKPLLDEEGNAIQNLEVIIEHDRDNKLKEEALFWLATIHFFRADYNAADDYYTELWRKHSNNANAPKACKQSILCKLQVNGGTIYNPKTIEEARKAMDDGCVRFPELAREKEWLDTHLKAIHLMQADRDYQIAEFYRRSSKYGAAYFYLELVKRRYPGTNYAKKADERIAEIRVLVEREQEAQRKEDAKLAERAARSDAQPQVQQASWLSRILPVSWQKKKDEPAPTPTE